jgi:hypothetical protein
MDCEKFESTLLDELYDELDEVTSAAAKRHVAGCARCASRLSGLKATRRMAALPIVDPPAHLEDRIFAAAREAQKVASIRSRASHALAWAGAWAMRPQTGMAALFLLSIGLSALFLQGKHAAPPSGMTVSEQGEPVATVATETLARPGGALAGDGKQGAPLAGPAATPVVAGPAASIADTKSDAILDVSKSRAATGWTGRVNAPAKAAPPADLKGLAGLADSDLGSSAGAGAGGAPPTHANAYGGASASQAPVAQGFAAPPASPPAPAARAAQEASPLRDDENVQAQPAAASGSFANAKAAYDAGDYANAVTLFDAVAGGGDLKAALWAARSAREGSGCANAVGRFDQVAAAGARTREGYDATLEGGRCYRQLGQVEAAQSRLRSLLTVPSYVDRAKTELAAMGPRASLKAAAKPTPPAAASPPPATTAY